MVGLRASVRAGLVGTEVDVRFSRDSVPILIHDATLDRTTTGSGAVAALTIAEIKGLDAGVKFDSIFSGATVPTLEEALTFSAGAGHRLYLDVKPQTSIPVDREAQLLIDAISKTNSESMVTVLSNSLSLLSALRSSAPTLSLGIVCGAYRSWQRSYAKQIGANTILYISTDSLLSRQYRAGIDSVLSAGLTVLTGAINDPQLADSLLSTFQGMVILTDIPPSSFRMGPPLVRDSLP